MPVRVLLAAAAVVVAAVAGCGSGGGSAREPAVGTFSAGPCRQMASDLVRVATATHTDATGTTAARTIEPALATARRGLRAMLPTAGAYRADLQRVSTAIGFLRLDTDTGMYTPALLREVRTATDALVARCTAGRPVS